MIGVFGMWWLVMMMKWCVCVWLMCNWCDECMCNDDIVCDNCGDGWEMMCVLSDIDDVYDDNDGVVMRCM